MIFIEMMIANFESVAYPWINDDFPHPWNFNENQYFSFDRFFQSGNITSNEETRFDLNLTAIGLPK